MTTVPADPPRTQAAVYSRALDEQARLLRLLDPIWRQAQLLPPSHPMRQTFLSSYQSLAEAEAGYVSRIVCELLEQTASSIPDVSLTPEQLLAPTAWLWLQQPFRIAALAEAEGAPDLTGNVRAVSWLTFTPDAHDRDVYPDGGVIVVLWLETTAALNPEPRVAATWGFGQTWRAAVGTIADAAGGPFVPETAVRWLAALNAFCDQRLFASRRGTPERAVRRRLERAGREPSEVLVVELRRVDQRRAEPSGEGGREWSCSWSVSGHWRRQWYESRQTHQAIWIAPYLKGDPEKPLRERKRVFAIVH